MTKSNTIEDIRKSKHLVRNVDDILEHVSILQPSLQVKEKITSHRNLVASCNYQGEQCFIKINKKGKLDNLISFIKNKPSTISFKIAETVKIGNFEYNNNLYDFIIQKRARRIGFWTSEARNGLIPRP